TNWMNPGGRSSAAVPSRETVYLPDEDMVLLAARTQSTDRWLWLAYDCTANAWKGLDLAGDDPIGKGTSSRAFHNSVGMMYDPNRKLVWFVGQNSEVYTLRLDLSSVELQSLN